MTNIICSNVGVSLRALMRAEAYGGPVPDIRATSCTGDWRQVQPGDVFVAVAQAETDGHDFAEDAARRGAVAIICERPLPIFDVPQLIVKDSRAAYGKLCQALVGKPSTAMKVVGVAGSHGKSTVARLLSSIFRAAGHTVGTLDSFGYWDGETDRPSTGRDLSPPELARSLAGMAAGGATHAVVELSSQEIAQQVPAGVEFDAVCLTNVMRKGAAWHGSLKNYRSATRRILDHLQPHGLVVLNADDPTSIEILSDLSFPALTFGLQYPAEISAHIIEQHINEQIFVLSAGENSVAVRTALIGDHHVYNCLAAASMALAYGIDLPVIARGLESIDRLPGRMERIMCGQNFAVLVDAADSPDALRTCLRAARQTTTGRLTCVFGAGDESDELLAIGRVLGAMADEAVITCGPTSLDGSHRSCLEIRSGFADTRKARVILDRGEAIRWALSRAEAGDTVVIAGMGERPHTPVGACGELANDSELAKEVLFSQGSVRLGHYLAA